MWRWPRSARFARDLHDLLGHSLSVIALKAELAGKLMAERPDDAAVEVREAEVALTNVIRHSGARRCLVRVTAGLLDTAVEVVDDGRGKGNGSDGGHNAGEAGNGLLGLAERAAGLAGCVESGTLPQGTGFRLRVSIPLGAHSR